jgi:hypothetical protein
MVFEIIKQEGSHVFFSQHETTKQMFETQSYSFFRARNESVYNDSEFIDGLFHSCNVVLYYNKSLQYLLSDVCICTKYTGLYI